MGAKSNAQGETQLLAEWLTLYAAGYPSKTHVFVGQQTLQLAGQPISPKRQAAFKAWSDWADARVIFDREVWLIEAKIVGVAAGYGQIFDYLGEYPSSADYQLCGGKPVVGVVLCAFSRPQTAARFASLGIRTVVFSPTWAEKTLATKIVGSLVDL
jgi:hypothetical protein